MPADDKFFTPEEIDEQIDFLAQRSDQETTMPAARVISHLQQLYAIKPKKSADTLERAWERIVAEHRLMQQPSEKKGQMISMQELKSKQAVTRGRSFMQRLSMLAAVACLGILIGGMILLLSTAHQAQVKIPLPTVKKQARSASGGTPVPKPPHPITGGKCTIDTTVTHPQQNKANIPGLYVFAANIQGDNILYRYDVQSKKVVWSKKFCNAFQTNISPPIEQNGILYLVGTDWTNTNTSGSVSYLYALNETDGSVIWGVQFPGKMTSIRYHPFGSPPNTTKVALIDLGAIETPTIANGIAYVVQRTGIVYALDASTGSQIWTFNTGRLGIGTSKDGNVGPISDPSSLQIVNGVAYGTIVDRLYALDAKSGRELWMHSFNDTLNIGHGLAIADGTLYIVPFVPDYLSSTIPDTYIYAFDAQTGIQKWASVKLRGLTDPIVLNGKLYTMSYDATWYTFNLADGAIEAHRPLPYGVGVPSLIQGVLYDASDTRLMVLNPNGSIRWSAPVFGNFLTFEDVQGGIIYIAGRGSGVYAYSAINGKLLWHYEGYLPQPDGSLWVSVVA